jgi:hypothetical protein
MPSPRPSPLSPALWLFLSPSPALAPAIKPPPSSSPLPRPRPLPTAGGTYQRSPPSSTSYSSGTTSSGSHAMTTLRPGRTFSRPGRPLLPPPRARPRVDSPSPAVCCRPRRSACARGARPPRACVAQRSRRLRGGTDRPAGGRPVPRGAAVRRLRLASRAIIIVIIMCCCCCCFVLFVL